ncbi:hypothetical protein [Streptomyces sp. NPDC096032]|uniref:hypothetical protein n=1 Tax=Streptomyces sp. NPDC096032 TaxID=3366070 RepID=UPI00380D553B
MHLQTRTRALRYTVVLTLVVLSLSGFSRGHHGRHGSGGGGCSSSHQDHDSSSSSTSGDGTYDDSDDDTYGSGGTTGGVGTTGGSSATGGSGTTGSTGGRTYHRRPTHRATATSSATSGRALKNGTAKLVACATAKKPYATVEIANPNGRAAEFQAHVLFYDDQGTQILDNSSYTVKVPARGTATTRVPVGDRLRLKVDHCEAEPEADVSS